MKYYTMMTKDMGRGVFAGVDLKAGDVICYCETLVLSEKDTRIVNQYTDLQYYTFKLNDRQDCLVLGDGEIFNHADDSNVEYKLIYLNDRWFMGFTAKKDVKKDQQLFINYTDDEKNTDTSKYNVNLI